MTARVVGYAAAAFVIGLAVGGGSWLLAALDGPWWSIPLVLVVGGSSFWLIARPSREPWREREGRRDGYVSDGDGPEVCITHPDGADDLFGDRERWAS